MQAGWMEIWDALDPVGDPRLVWLRPVPGREVVLLPGAFDPPTLAHVALAAGAAAATGLPAAFCATTVQLDRREAPLLTPHRRLALLDAIAAEIGAGLAACNRGTYLEMARAARAGGLEPVFVVGSDKLAQLEDPSFYPDGRDGVEATFREVRFLVVPRGVPVTRAGMDVLDRVLDEATASISATEVRRRLEQGLDIGHLVPAGVGLALAGYTRDTESR